MPGFSTETRLDGTSEFKLDRNGACVTSCAVPTGAPPAPCSIPERAPDVAICQTERTYLRAGDKCQRLFVE